MAPRIAIGLLAATVLCAFVRVPPARAQDTAARQVEPLVESRLPDLPRAAVGPIVGYSGGAVVVAGGRDRDTGAPVAAAYALPDGASEWVELSLARPLADAGVAIVGDDIVCVGGTRGGGPVSAAVALTFAGGELVESPLPDLPEPTRLAGAAAVGSSVYVVGGVGTDGNPVRDSFRRLDLEAATGPESGTTGEPGPAWEILSPVPVSGLRRPVVTAQAGDVLVLGGELGPRGGEAASVAPQVTTEAWRYRPVKLDATTWQGWLDMADLPAPWLEPAVFPTGQSHVMVLGGRSPLPGTGRDRRIFIYHAITDVYSTHSVWSGAVDAPRAVKRSAEEVVLVGGQAALGAAFAHTTQTLSGIDYAVIGLYLCGLLGIGLYFANKEKTTGDFFLGGRKIPWWAVGVSLYATGTSAISFMAIPTKAWATSTLYGVEGLVGLVGTVASAYLVIPIVRRLDITSTYEYLERRFNKYMRLWGSGLCVAFQMGGRMSVVLLLPSLAISAVTGIPVIPCIAAMGVLATAYTVLGGISAVIWTDVIQVVVLFGGALLAFALMVLGSDGGVTGWAAANAEYEKFRAFDLSMDYTQPVLWIVLAGAIIHIGTATSDQVMVQRVLSTPTVRQARRSYITLAAIVLPGSLLFTFLGTAMFGYFRAHPEMLNPTMENIHALPLFIVHGLPRGLTGLVIAALFAASMSTLDSSMNSVSTLAVTDFYKRFRPAADDHRCLVLGKWLTAAVGAVGTGAALLMATFEIKSIFDMWMQLSYLVMGGFGGVFILGMFTRRANGWGALVGAVSSIGITAAVKAFTDLHFWAYGWVSVLACVGVGYVCSLFLPHREVDLDGLTVYTPKQTGFEG